MSFFGLHLADWIVLLGYLAALLWIGKATASSVHNQRDFFLAGRHLGRIYQFFLNFGSMTDAAGAAKTSSIVYNQGVGGIWITLQTLFMTPYYWFMNPWFRRVRLTTMSDLMTDRFGGHSLAVIYAVCAILFGVVNIGGGFLVTYKIFDVFVAKPVAEHTQQESEMLAKFQEFVVLNSAYKKGQLAESDEARYRDLKVLRDRGVIKSHVSLIRPLPFYILCAVVVAIYLSLGGMTAAAITDALQGVLIVIFSVILIPFGIWKIGSWGEFQRRLPSEMLELFGSGAGSEFAWYSVAAILLLSIVQIHAGAANMSIGGSARDELAASVGAVTGGFTKRLMIIAWCFCGLVAFALFGRGVSDPDAVWGALSKSLLGPGFLGLLLVGILAAEMSTFSSMCLSMSALFVRNIYLPLFPHKTEHQGLNLGRALIAVSLFGGIGVAFLIDDLLSFTKIALTLNVAFGAAVLVIFKWNRVTKAGVLVSVLLSFLVIVAVPLVVPAVPALNALPSLHLMTREQSESRMRTATEDDIAAGRAQKAGQRIEGIEVIAPRPVFFDRLLSTSPGHPDASRYGQGRFHFELFLLSLAGIDLTGLKPAQLFAMMYVFDSLFPFFFLFGISLLTRDGDPARSARFYAKMRTPVKVDPDEDSAVLAARLADPSSSEHAKLFPGSSWELLRWKRRDTVAFFACCGIALAILGGFALLLNLGRA